MSITFPRRSLLIFGVPLVAQTLPNQDPGLVKEMVGASHSNLKRVKEFVEQDPSMVRATIDWGFGDWETAIGAASHVGNREIAEYLLARGAVPTIFSAAMLGHLSEVKGMVAAMPGIQRTYGPHGITLLAHARAGGEKSIETQQYLTGLGDAGIALPTQPLGIEEKKAVAGRYVFGDDPLAYFEVDLVQDQLGIFRPGSPARRLLFHAGGLVFFPSGAPWAKITFTREGERVTGLSLGRLSAKRI
jgi:hypothetical protein